MSDIYLPILFNGLGPSYCFTSWDQLGLDLSNAQKALLANGRTFYNIGPNKPAPEFEGYPWFRTTDGRWYEFQGKWRSVNWRLTGEHHWEEFTTEAAVWSWDGGDGDDPSVTPPTIVSGAMWQVDHAYDGRSPMSPGDIPGLTTAHTVLPATNDGLAEIILTPEQMTHWHGTGTDGSTDDPAIMLARPWSLTPETYTQRYNDLNTTGSSGWQNGAAISSGTMGTTKPMPEITTPPTPTPLTHTVRGMFCCVRTARTYYVVP
jgi:hypothetical protein